MNNSNNETATYAKPSESMAVDQDRLLAYLKQHVEGIEGPLDIKKFSGGQSNPTYRIKSGERVYVLRRKPHGEIHSSAHAIDREARVMQALGSSAVPVPDIISHCEDDSVIGQEFYIMEFLDGRIFWDPLLPECDMEERKDIYYSLTDALADLHNIAPEDVGLEKFGPTSNYYKRQIDRWYTQYKAAGDPVDGMGDLFDWLIKNLPEQETISIVHGDYRLDNVIFDREQGKATGVIDWELSTLGCPFGDLSYYLLGWLVPISMKSGSSLASSNLEALGIPSLEEITARYFERSKLEPPKDFTYYHVYNLFRLASIMHGISARAKAGNASNTGASRFGGLIPFVVSFAKGLIEPVNKTV
ncbi:phosphotransferase family protein [Maricurvus nonylphenolicus]|uniref:phosphotransferase family protein n=1 Tax=Maricurvus nonylphenolicus TaxID=1008307 RepID=UPI0036F2CE67